jgi:hypothetical protein
MKDQWTNLSKWNDTKGPIPRTSGLETYNANANRKYYPQADKSADIRSRYWMGKHAPVCAAWTVARSKADVVTERIFRNPGFPYSIHSWNPKNTPNKTLTMLATANGIALPEEFKTSRVWKEIIHSHFSHRWDCFHYL